MELYQLKYFQTVARLGHMTQAAEALNISQPSLSRAIALLEQEIGVPLFDRIGRRIRLNQYGEVLLRRVDFILSDLERARREIADLSGPEQGAVVLAVPQSIGSYLLPALLSAFRQEHPQIRFQIVPYQDAQASPFIPVEQLEEGRLDLCFCPPPPEAMQVEWLKWQPVVTDELCLAVPRSHRFVERDILRLVEVASDPFIGLLPGTHFRRLTDVLCQQAGLEPDIVMEVGDLPGVWEMVSAGIGVAILPGRIKQQASEQAPRLLRLDGTSSQWTIGIAWDENYYLSLAVRLFRQFVIDYFTR